MVPSWFLFPPALILSKCDWNGSAETSIDHLGPARREFEWENRWKKMAKRFLSWKSPTALGLPDHIIISCGFNFIQPQVTLNDHVAKLKPKILASVRLEVGSTRTKWHVQAGPSGNLVIPDDSRLCWGYDLQFLSSLRCELELVGDAITAGIQIDLYMTLLQTNVEVKNPPSADHFPRKPMICPHLC